MTSPTAARPDTANIVCLRAFRATGRRMPPIDLVAQRRLGEAERALTRLLPGDRARCTVTGKTGFIQLLLPAARVHFVLDDGGGILVSPESVLDRIHPTEVFA